jgi:hypothetical protein
MSQLPKYQDQRVKLVGNVKMETFKAFKRTALENDITLGELMDKVANNYEFITQWLKKV